MCAAAKFEGSERAKRYCHWAPRLVCSNLIMYPNLCCRYILVYPQGCDVCNHLSLFLCVADYDKLLPGWSHFAQFTIAVVNKDPKKSKYSGARAQG